MLTRDDLAALDGADPLAGFRERFDLPEGIVYLDGNSLGARPLGAPDSASALLGEWEEDLIAGWQGRGWWDLPVRVGGRIAGLLGAAPHQVICCDTVTVNLYKVLHAAVALRPDRRVVLLRDSAFPTDRYVVESVARSTGRAVRLVPRGEDPLGHLDGDIAVAVLEHSDFRTGELLDMGPATASVHAAGGLAVWDLSHTAGVVPIALDGDGADFAVGCTYKWLNGGPGSPAYLFAAERHLDASEQPVPGWLSHADPFAMTDDYRPHPGIRRFLTGTQAILSMRTVEAALDAYEGVDLHEVRAKSMQLTDLFVRLIDERCPGLEVVSPRDAFRRSSQVTVRHPRARELHPGIVGSGVVGDFREPDLLRFGFAPLYVGYTDVWDAVEVLAAVTG